MLSNSVRTGLLITEHLNREVRGLRLLGRKGKFMNALRSEKGE